MSDELRDDMEQARAEHFTSRRAHYYDEQREADLIAQSEAESEEAIEAAWLRAFAKQAAEQPRQHWAERPGYDRRLHAVDGDVDPHRPDAPEYDIPWPA